MLLFSQINDNHSEPPCSLADLIHEATVLGGGSGVIHGSEALITLPKVDHVRLKSVYIAIKLKHTRSTIPLPQINLKSEIRNGEVEGTVRLQGHQQNFSTGGQESRK